MAYRILVPQTGIELLPSAVKEQRLNHWTREFPPLSREWFSIISYQSFILLEFFSRYCPIVPAPIIKYVIYLTAFIFLIFFFIFLILKTKVTLWMHSNREFLVFLDYEKKSTKWLSILCLKKYTWIHREIICKKIMVRCFSNLWAHLPTLNYFSLTCFCIYHISTLFHAFLFMNGLHSTLLSFTMVLCCAI